MKYFSIFEQTSKELVRDFAKKRNLTEYVSKNYDYPQEDCLMASDTHPIFVVSDGVTLNFTKLVENNAKYPNPSPAGDVAKIFCEAVIKSASGKYGNFSKENIVEVFSEANSEVATYNLKIGRNDISGNQTGFYSATGSFLVVNDGKGYWASICDSFVAHFDKNMNLKFISTGLYAPYAVINGEERMVEHLESGVLDLENGDRVFVLTDGFEHYIKNPDFQKLFLQRDDQIKESINKFSEEMIAKDSEKYGHERSLIAVSI